MTGVAACDLGSLLADAARALAADGDLQTSRQRFEMAFQQAEQAGDANALALAALGLGGAWVHEHRTAAGSAMVQARLRQALSGVDPRSPVGIRLRARLAAETDYRTGEHSKILAVLDEARTVADPIVRAEVRSLAHHCLLGPDHGALRRELAAEMVEDSYHTMRRGDLLIGLLWQTVDMFLDGDPLAQRRLRDLRELLGQGDHLAVNFVTSAIEVMLAIRAGRFEQAEAQAMECARRGEAAGDVDSTGWHGAQLVTIRWYQGRVAELVPMLTDLVHSPTLSAVDYSFFAALAVAAASAGDRRTAAGALATLSSRDLADLPRSSSWLVTMNGVVEAAHLLGDVDISARTYELLRPYADLPMVASLGIACFGSVQHALGVASLTIGDVDTALRHLSAAVRQNLALAHWPAVVASRLRYAQALLRRARPEDEVNAQLELAAAATEAAALGIELPSAPMSDGAARQQSPEVATCGREGQSWRIGLGGRSVVVGQSVGMLHLAVLIANPGQEVSAAELVSGLAGLRGSAEGRGLSEQPVLDRVTAQTYRDRLSRLRAEIDELESRNDLDRAARARAERDWIMTELARAAGLGGRVRRFQDGGERARIAVSKAVRRALARITEADAVIGEHLSNSVHTGVRCSYRPL